MNIYKAVFKRRGPMLILSNGSERSDFVPLPHIFETLKRYHDGFQIMKTFYPYDSLWNTKRRVSEISEKKNTNYAWDYEYDDYHPLDILQKGGDTRKEMDQIKCFGADIHLTLTADITLSDELICRVLKKLCPYGRVYLRLNHECNGYWFRHNKQHSYGEVGRFFCRVHELIERYAPNVRTVFSITGDLSVKRGLVMDDELQLTIDGMKDALSVADYWSIDKYVSLNYGWPFDNVTGNYVRCWRDSVDQWWRILEETYLKMVFHNGMKAKQLFINEFNADADLDGEQGQASIVSSVYNRIARGEFDWLKGITFYQFRDYGGLGLEKGAKNKYRTKPVFKSYQNAIEKFSHHIETDNLPWKREDFTFRWHSSERFSGLRVRDFSGSKTFQNRFEFPVFAVFNANQQWRRLEPLDRLAVRELNEFFLVCPPIVDRDDGLRTGMTLKNIKGQLERMFV